MADSAPEPAVALLADMRGWAYFFLGSTPGFGVGGGGVGGFDGGDGIGMQHLS